MGSQLIYILMALFWAGLEDDLSLKNVVVGYIVGVALVALARYLLPNRSVGRHVPTPGQIWHTVVFVAHLLWEITVANIVVIRTVLRPKLSISPGIVAVPVEVRSDVEITMLGNSITLTPGTWTMEPSSDRGILFVHALDAADRQAVKDDIRAKLETHVLRVTRC